jgi:hypothetical protein
MRGKVGIRRGGVVAAVAVAASLATALPANAGGTFDSHFSVFSQQIRGHRTASGFAFRTALLNPANTFNRVGYAHAKCRAERGQRKAHCKVLFHFDGSVGGFGDLLVKGNFGRGDHTANVVDGNGSFSGAITGKAFIHNLGRNNNLIDFALTR